MSITATITTLNYDLSATSATSITATAKAGSIQLNTTSSTEASTPVYLRSITIFGIWNSSTVISEVKTQLATEYSWIQVPLKSDWYIDMSIPLSYFPNKTVSNCSYKDDITFYYQIAYSSTSSGTVSRIPTSSMTVINPIKQSWNPKCTFSISLNGSSWSGSPITQQAGAIDVTNIQCTNGQKYDGSAIVPTHVTLAVLRPESQVYSGLKSTSTIHGGSINYTMDTSYTRGATYLFGVYWYWSGGSSATRGYTAIINQLPTTDMPTELIYEPGATESVPITFTTTDNDTSQTLSVYGTIDSGAEQLLINDARGEKIYNLDTSGYSAATGSDITLQYRAYDGLEYSAMQTATISKDSGYVHYSASTDDYGKVNYWNGNSWQEADQVYEYNNGWQLSIK